MTESDLGVVCCPACRGPLTFDGTCVEGELDEGDLVCAACAARWAVTGGLACLFDERAVRGPDRLMRLIYDSLAPLHDPAVEYVLPLLQGSSSRDLREGYMPYLELARLEPSRSGARPRILEVGVGTGANLALIERDLPAGLDVELWGCDLSRGMLDRCRAGRPRGDRPERLLLSDAHALPFRSASFDRVFHVGGISGYRDPQAALAEMARVAMPATPIVVVDEQLDPARCHGPLSRLAFFALTFYNPGASCPRDDLPAGAVDVLETQISRFYYCLRFRVPALKTRSSPRTSSAAPSAP